MSVALFSASLLTLACFLHVVIWRARLPRSHTRALLMLFLGVLPVALAANTLLPSSSLLRLDGIWQYIQVGLFHVSMSLSYIEFYTTIEEDSPSMTILLFVDDAGTSGRLESELVGLIGDEVVVGKRLQSLVNGRLVAQDGDVYRVMPRGRAWIRCFTFVRRVYHLGLGG